ncbi:progranulin-like [Sycon ciliatum]|uniref:progranulin-like n=1 Tax=Sycon ciliatum TaxID=27933 RepID=UPI0020AC535F|eukprot:scpid79000/ scgid28071/ Granulins; Proepithelin; Acrogranin; Granulin-1; Granulin-2; Granulin-3; Granulin-4; Granulin-5; Granulin-6; Granulin-7
MIPATEFRRGLVLLAGIGLLIATYGSGSGTVVCPGGRTECDDGETCCQKATGDYGCCGAVNAVCCSDLVHCCPEGYYCDPHAQECKRSGTGRLLSLPFLRLESETRHKQRSKLNSADTLIIETPVNMGTHDRDFITVSRTMCPDGHDCPGNQTCCLQKNGMYGCCTLENAVCCSDGVHCCPADFTCTHNGTHTGCEQEGVVLTQAHTLFLTEKL